MSLRGILAGVASIALIAFAAPTSAAVLTFTLTGGGNPIDQFTLDSSAGQTDGAGTPPYVYFKLLTDADGYNAAYFGDSSASLGQLGIGYGNGNLVTQYITESFTPAFYQGDGVNVPFTDGSFTAGNGDILTISGAVPEPASWALMLAGIGVAGAGLRFSRRKTSPAAAAV